MATWYLTKYARLANGKVELLTYTEMPFNEAKYHAKKFISNDEFYCAENILGSLLEPQPKPCWVVREHYSHKPHVAKMQADAEIKAQQLLDMLQNYTFDVKDIFSDIQTLKPLLTKPQYSILLSCLMSKPQVKKILYERSH